MLDFSRNQLAFGRWEASTVRVRSIKLPIVCASPDSVPEGGILGARLSSLLSDTLLLSFKEGETATAIEGRVPL